MEYIKILDTIKQLIKLSTPIEKEINIDSLCTQTKNCTVRELILLGIKVYFNDKRGWFGDLMDFIIIKPIRSEFYFENIKLFY